MERDIVAFWGLKGKFRFQKTHRLSVFLNIRDLFSGSLNLDSVLFTSAAAGGKAGTVGVLAPV